MIFLGSTSYIPIINLTKMLKMFNSQKLTIYERDLFAFAKTLVRDTDAARELVQATQVRALEKAALYTKDDNFRGWLFEIMSRLHKTAQRSNGSKSRAAIKYQMDIAAHFCGHPLSSQQKAVELAETMEALETLPPEYREIIRLRVFEDMGNEEAAAMLGIPPGSAASRLHAARALLAERVENGWKGLPADDRSLAQKFGDASSIQYDSPENQALVMHKRRLSRRQQEFVERVIEARRTAVDVADEIGISPMTIRTTLCNARKRVQGLMQAPPAA